MLLSIWHTFCAEHSGKGKRSVILITHFFDLMHSRKWRNRLVQWNTFFSIASPSIFAIILNLGYSVHLCICKKNAVFLKPMFFIPTRDYENASMWCSFKGNVCEINQWIKKKYKKNSSNRFSVWNENVEIFN